MNCCEFQNQLERAVEERLSPSPELQAHAAGCPADGCRFLWDNFTLLSTAIPEWKQHQEMCRVVAEAFPNAVTPRRSHRRAQLTVLATCAASLLVVASFISPIQNSSVNGRSDLAHLPRPTIAVSPAAEDNPELSAFPASIVAVSAGSLHGAAVNDPVSLPFDWIAHAPLQVTSSMAYVLLGERGQPVEEAAPAGKTWMETWPEELRPVQDDIEAFRSLLIETPENQTRDTGLGRSLLIG